MKLCLSRLSTGHVIENGAMCRVTLLVAAVLLQIPSAAAIAAQTRTSGEREKGIIANRKMASDGVTEGWFVEYPNPDPNQSWRKIMGTLVIAQHGRIVRRMDTDLTFWSWNFWDGGKMVAYQLGPVHGETVCVLADVQSGKETERWKGDCRNVPENAPGWVKAAVDIQVR
jgi:hypothetical protein